MLRVASALDHIAVSVDIQYAFGLAEEHWMFRGALIGLHDFALLVGWAGVEFVPLLDAHRRAAPQLSILRPLLCLLCTLSHACNGPYRVSRPIQCATNAGLGYVRFLGAIPYIQKRPLCPIMQLTPADRCRREASLP